MYKTQLVISAASSSTWSEVLKSLFSSRESWTSSFQPALSYCVVKILILVGMFLSRWRTCLFLFFFKHGTDFEYVWVYLRKQHFCLTFRLVLFFLNINNLEGLLCHSLSYQSSVLVFTFHLQFYYPWVHWLLLLSSQKCFKSFTPTFFPCCTY